MYYPENMKDTDKNDTQISNVLKKLGTVTAPNGAPGNPSGLLSQDIQTKEKNSTYSVAKNLSAPNDDIKALQHSLNVFEFTDRDGKKLDENGIWGLKQNGHGTPCKEKTEIPFGKQMIYIILRKKNKMTAKTPRILYMTMIMLKMSLF